MNRCRLPLLALALAAYTTASIAAPVHAAEAAAPAVVSAFLADVESNLTDAEQKLVDLAGAIPAEKWSWRPGEGCRCPVRSPPGCLRRARRRCAGPSRGRCRCL